jgi:general secretion pathway protein K
MPTMRRSTPDATRQRGVAIITALVVVAAATVAVSAMFWRESVAVRKVENQAALGQARWLARSAIEWARLVLLQDARTSTVDHLGEIWAVPLAETRVTDDLAASPSNTQPGTTAAPFADNDSAWVSGRMRDAQARINLQGLAIGDKVDDQRFEVLQRLMTVLDLDHDLAKTIALRAAMAPKVATFNELARVMTAEGTMSAAVADRLRPFLVILPAPTPVNLNTAPAEVLAAVFPNLPLDAARALVRSRDQAWFKQVADAVARLPGTGGDDTPTNASVSTNFFEVDGAVHVGRADLQIAALIERQQNGATRVRSMVER